MVETFTDIGRQVHNAEGTIQDIEIKLRDFIKADLSRRGLDDKILSSVNLDVYDLKMSARGLAHYFGIKQ